MGTDLGHWDCVDCGPRPDESVVLYDESAGVFNAHSLRFGPWCGDCGRRVVLSPSLCERGRAVPGRARTALVLSGTCASGKSHVSFELAMHHGYVQIDGDWAWTMIKAETGMKIASDAIHPDLMNMAYGVALMGRRVVVAHVVRPAEFERYRQFFAERRMSMRAAVLQPAADVVLDRNQHRKCWPQTTPDHWVRYFLEEYAAWDDTGDVTIYDNSSETPAETAARIALLAGTAESFRPDA